MATAAQTEANRANAQASTGPRTEEGKANSSRNGITAGLYTAGDFIRPGEESDYDALDENLRSELVPEGFLESLIFDDIRRALWRLRRCGNVEAKLADNAVEASDPMESNDPATKIQLSVDRARAESQRQFHKGMAELRKLQTERRYRNEFFKPDYDFSHLGLADFRSVMKGISEHCRLELQKRKIGDLDTWMKIVNLATKREPSNSASAHAADLVDVTPTNQTQSEPEAEADFTNRTQSQSATTPRNAKCPCGSGQKHKRCCGKDAPPLLFAA